MLGVMKLTGVILFLVRNWKLIAPIFPLVLSAATKLDLSGSDKKAMVIRNLQMVDNVFNTPVTAQQIDDTVELAFRLLRLTGKLKEVTKPEATA